MKRARELAWALFLTTGFLAAQEGAPPEAARKSVDAAAAGNRFALDLYRELAGEGGNLALSPIALRSALAMTCAGARGRTEEQMERVLHLAGDGEASIRAVGELSRDLVAGSGEDGWRLRIASALWGQTGMDVRSPFQGFLEEGFGAGLERVDFAADPEAARRLVNAWIEERTEDRVRDLLQAGDVLPVTRLILATAIAFEGRWPVAFSAEHTSNRPFFAAVHTEEGVRLRQIEVPTMTRLGTWPMWSGDGLDVLELPYQGDALSMVILLPRERDGLGALEASLTPGFLEERLAKLREQEVGLFLPRLDLSCRLPLKPTLKALGMTDAFGGEADFSGMTGARDLHVDDVIQKTVVKVDEEGTEAAGAAAVLMKKRGRFLRADHPFLFLIRDRRSGAILFLGRVENPSRP